MASIASIFLDIFHASGVTTSSLSITQYILRHAKLSFILHFKVVPDVLCKVSDPLVYANLISKISVGRTFKTTNFERHNFSDDLILDIIRKSDQFDQPSFADIGVSDGSGSVYLADKLKAMNIDVVLLDKYQYLRVIRNWCGKKYVNEDGYIVGLKLLFLYIYCFPLHIRADYLFDSQIRFINPVIYERSLSIEYFDIFSSQSAVPFSFIKAANLLNMCYFSKQELLAGFKNLHRSIADGGYLFIIQNQDNYESLLVLKKSSGGFSVESSHNDPELLDLASNRKISWDK